MQPRELVLGEAAGLAQVGEPSPEVSPGGLDVLPVSHALPPVGYSAINNSSVTHSAVLLYVITRPITGQENPARHAIRTRRGAAAPYGRTTAMITAHAGGRAHFCSSDDY